jgi:transcriptional regulator with XRE-family HTH domain
MTKTIGRNSQPDSHEVRKAIGERLKKARLEAGGMSQRELGELLGVTERSIQSYEQGVTVPYRFGAKLTEALGVPVSWLWYGDAAIEDPGAKFDAIMDELKSLRREVTRLSKAVGASSPRKAS